MNFFKVGIFLVLVHGAVCCEKYLDCEECLQKSCRFLVTSDREAVCAGRDDKLSVLKEIKKPRFCKFVDLYTKENGNAPSSPNEVQITKAIHAAKMKDISRTLVESTQPTNLPESTTTMQSVTTDLADIKDARLNLAIHAAKIRDATRKTTVSPLEDVPIFRVDENPTEDATISPTENITETLSLNESTEETVSESTLMENTTPVSETTTTEETVSETTTMEKTTSVSESTTMEETVSETTTMEKTTSVSDSTTMENTTPVSETTTTEETVSETTTMEKPVRETTISAVAEQPVQLQTTAQPTLTVEVTSELSTTPTFITTEVLTTEMNNKSISLDTTNVSTVVTEVNTTLPEKLPICKSEGNKTLHNVDGHQQDSDVILSDVEEIFMSFKLIFNCQKENRNDSLMFAYVSSLCSIARLSEQIGIHKFSDRDQSFFMGNRARRFDATCSAVRYIKKRCRVPSPPKIRVQKKGMLNGPRSPLYERVYASYRCEKKASKEDILSRLARITCYSGELFLELYRLVELNSYDVSYGLGNPSHRYPSKCLGLFFKKRHCYDKKLV